MEQSVNYIAESKEAGRQYAAAAISKHLRCTSQLVLPCDYKPRMQDTILQVTF